MKGLFGMFCTKLTDRQIKRRVEYMNKKHDELVAINRQKKRSSKHNEPSVSIPDYTEGKDEDTH
jgi:hypothetical protein